MKTIPSKLLKGILLLLTIPFLASCGSFEDNDNAELYYTEWSTDNNSEGLKFYDDDTVLYFSTGYMTKTGTFEYDASNKSIYFRGLVAQYPSFTSEMTWAEMISKNKMHLHWHELGKSEGYYMVLYKRR